MTENILEIMAGFKCKAVIFDLDGTLLDNNPYHLKAWKQYLQRLGRELSDEEYKKHLNGRTNKDVVEYLLQRKMNDEEVLPYALEKERTYRELYKPYIAPVVGLIALLELLAGNNIPMAIATSGIQPNIDFMFENVPIKHFFKVVVNSSHITKGKPDPEIFLKTAALLGQPPASCLVFEDAVVGIKSAQAADMKVIAIATTEKRERLSAADRIIENYTELL